MGTWMWNKSMIGSEGSRDDNPALLSSAYIIVYKSTMPNAVLGERHDKDLSLIHI